MLRTLLGSLFVAAIGIGGFFVSATFLQESAKSAAPGASSEPLAVKKNPAPNLDAGEAVDLAEASAPHEAPGGPAQAVTDPRSAEAAVVSGAEATIEPLSENLSVLLLQGDNFLAEANPASALKRYTALLKHTSGARRPEVLVRIALSEEAVGDHHSALKDYRELAATGVANLVVAARLGQARLWQSQQQYAYAETILFDLLLNEAGPGMNLGLRSDAAHLVAAILTGNVVDDFRNRILDDQSLILPTLTRPLPHLLDDAMTTEQLPVDPPADGLKLLIGKRGEAPDEIQVAVRYPRRPVIEILAELARACGYRVRGTREIQQILSARGMKIESRQVTAAILLDGMLSADGLLWKFEGDELQIFPSDGPNTDVIDAARIRKAERSLQNALSTAPEHTWAPAAYIALGKLRTHADDLPGAERYLEQAMRIYPRSEFDSCAAFNLGKVRLVLGKLPESQEAFLRSVDASHGKPLEPAGYLYAGRISLEMGQPRAAIIPLQRAVALKGSPQVTRVASLTLASAYLLGGNAPSANAVLLGRKAELADDRHRDTTAFLSALAQYRSAENDEARRSRDGRSLLSSLAHVTGQKHFGWAIPFLAAQAASELNLSDEARRLYEVVALSPYHHSLQDASLYALATLRWEAGEQAAAVDILAGLIETANGDWQRHARIQRCGYALQLSNGPAVLTDGQRLLAENLSSEERAAVLRLMGEALQRQGKHELAAYCFAGVSPAELLEAPTGRTP